MDIMQWTQATIMGIAVSFLLQGISMVGAMCPDLNGLQLDQDCMGDLQVYNLQVVSGNMSAGSRTQLCRSYSKSVSCINRSARGCLDKPNFKKKFERYKSTHKEGPIGQICINETLSLIYYRHTDCYSQHYKAYSECTTDAIDWDDADPCEMLSAMRNCSDHIMSGPCGQEAVGIFSSTILKAEIPNTLLMQKCAVVYSTGSQVITKWLTIILLLVTTIMR